MTSWIHLLQLLQLVSLGAASHYYAGSSTVTFKGKNPDGSITVVVRSRSTFDGCSRLNWGCRSGNCGSVNRVQHGIIDSGTNAPVFNRQWCETEIVEKRVIRSDKPFQLSAASCCWIPKRLGSTRWALRTTVDLGRRSDTGIPNRSPDVAILPFLRIPQNCPRKYKLMSFDPDGDQVQCRYGLLKNAECAGCSQPPGFFLDRASCTLQYQFALANPRVFGFELVVEDFPRKHITLTYSDGSSVRRSPLIYRKKRQAGAATTPWWWVPTTTTTPWWWFPTTTEQTTTTPPWWTTTTTAPTTTTPWWTTTTTTTAPTTTTPWWTTTTTAPTTTTPWWTTTTTAPTTTTPWWTTTTTAPTTTTTAPTTTTTAPTTTTTAPTTTTTAPTTTTPWWTTTTTAPTTTTTAPTTTTTAPTTTTPWWTTTTTDPTTTTSWWTTTTKRTTTYPTTTTTTTPPLTPPWWTTSTYSTPLSQLPLQFSLLVDPPVPSCHEGLYLPKLVYPTPEEGARIQAEVDKVVEIRVKGEVEYGRINDIIVSGPLNITQHKTTHDEFVIRWKPVAHNLWNHYPICFAVESVLDGSYETTTHYPGYTHHHLHKRDGVIAFSHSGVYHSEMRCVVVDVREDTVKTNVICTEYAMTVELEKYSLAGLHEDHLHLNDPSDVLCSLQTHSNKSHIIGIVPLNSCGTQIEEDKDNLIFRNAITAFDSSGDLITRKHKLDVQFYCQYPKRGNVTLNFVAHRKMITVWDRGMGTFTYQFEFYPDETYDVMINPNSYPLVYKIGTRIYMQIEATSSVSNTELFVETCRASPYDTPNYTPTYSIIENGCNVDPTVMTHPSANKKMFRFSLEAFKFIGMYPQVYISCSVLMCEAGNKNTRCSRGCIRSAWPSDHSGHKHRRKREAAIQSQNHFVSQGPLRLRSAAEESGSPVTLNLNLVFIAGCLLAAMAMISILILYRKRQRTIKYHPLLLTDTFE